ncbi:hypothetical protein GCM10027456_81350 [Kineosporia babensis]
MLSAVTGWKPVPSKRLSLRNGSSALWCRVCIPSVTHTRASAASDARDRRGSV